MNPPAMSSVLLLRIWPTGGVADVHAVTDFLQFIVMGLGIVLTSILVVMQVGWSDLVNGLWNHWLAAPASAAAGATASAAHPFNPFHPSSFGSGYLLTWATVIYNDIILPCVKKPLAEVQRLLITRTLVLLIGVIRG